MNKYELKIKIQDCTDKIVQESYIVEAHSIFEAVTKLNEKIQEIEEIESATKKNYTELILNDKEKFYEIKVAFITLDEKAGKEKRTHVNMLVQASSIDDAKSEHDRHMKDTLSDYEVVAVRETKIIDVIM